MWSWPPTCAQRPATTARRGEGRCAPRARGALVGKTAEFDGVLMPDGTAARSKKKSACLTSRLSLDRVLSTYHCWHEATFGFKRPHFWAAPAEFRPDLGEPGPVSADIGQMMAWKRCNFSKSAKSERNAHNVSFASAPPSVARGAPCEANSAVRRVEPTGPPPCPSRGARNRPISRHPPSTPWGSSNFLQFRPNLNRVWPLLDQIGIILTEFGHGCCDFDQIWIDQMCAELDQVWTSQGPNCPKSGRHRSRSAKFAHCFARFRPTSTDLMNIWPGPCRIWPSSAQARRILARSAQKGGLKQTWVAYSRRLPHARLCCENPPRMLCVCACLTHAHSLLHALRCFIRVPERGLNRCLLEQLIEAPRNSTHTDLSLARNRPDWGWVKPTLGRVRPNST